MHFLLFLLSPIWYQDETWWNISATYDKHFSLIMKTGPSSRSFLFFQPIAVTEELIIISFKFFVLLKVFPETITVVNHQLRK